MAGHIPLSFNGLCMANMFQGMFSQGALHVAMLPISVHVKLQRWLC